jgi:hypothetical protein
MQRRADDGIQLRQTNRRTSQRLRQRRVGQPRPQSRRKHGRLTKDNDDTEALRGGGGFGILAGTIQLGE